MTFKVGDRFVDVGGTIVYPPNSRGTIVSVETKRYRVRFDSHTSITLRNFDDKDVIPEELFDSPLYEALS